MLKHLEAQLAEREAQSLRRHRRIAETACAPLQTVTAHDGPPRELLAFCSNDYLGLANHPLLIEALAEGARLYGAGSGASHLISGHSRAHALLEDDLAEMLSPHGPELRALTFCTGYMANMALLTALGDAQTTIYTDLLNHASLIDGARLAKATVYTYLHNDLAGLERRIAACSTPRKSAGPNGAASSPARTTPPTPRRARSSAKPSPPARHRLTAAPAPRLLRRLRGQRLEGGDVLSEIGAMSAPDKTPAGQAPASRPITSKSPGSKSPTGKPLSWDDFRLINAIAERRTLPAAAAGL
eukprot:gene39579-53510_t